MAGARARGGGEAAPREGANEMSEIYPMIPAASKAVWFLAAIGGLLLLVAGLLVAVAVASGHTRVRVDAAGVSVEGDPLFARTIPWSELESERAEVVRIVRDSPHRPTRRTWGTGLPGYAAGWFRLASGEKALVFLTRGERAVHVPTRAGWSLLITVEDLDGLAARLRAGAAGG